MPLTCGCARLRFAQVEDALRIADRSGDDLALALARMTLGLALVHRPRDAERDRGQKLLAEVSDVFLRQGYLLGTDGTLWLEHAPFGTVPPARQQIDGNVADFQAVDATPNQVLVRSVDGRADGGMP